MRARPLVFASLLTLCLLAACETRHPASPPAGTPTPRAQLAPPAATPLPATSAPVPRTDTTLLLSRALGTKLTGYRLESFATGDLNQDGRPDFIAIFQTVQAQDSTASEPRGFHYRRVALLLNQGWPDLKLAATNDNVIACSGCAHMAIFDAYRGTTIKGPYFSFESTDGGCERVMEVITFKYSKAQQNWFLHKVGSDMRSCSDTTGELIHSEKTSRDFGKIAFAKYESVSPN